MSRSGTSHASATERPPSRVVRLIERGKQHQVVVVLTAVAAVITFVGTLWSPIAVGARAVYNGMQPFHNEYRNLAKLDLEMTSAAVQGILGVPTRRYDLCEVVECPEGTLGRSDLVVYEIKGGAVRAVFDNDQLMLFMVTQRDGDFRPPILWLENEEKGRLGDRTFAEVLRDVVKPADKPTDVHANVATRSVSYAETFAYGDPGHYEGFLLAHAPDGYSGEKGRFDLDAALALSRSESDPDAGLINKFREGSTPNTYGSYRDDGDVGEIAHEAENLQAILYAGVT